MPEDNVKELTEQFLGSRDDTIDKDAWDDFMLALEGGNDD